MFHAMEFVGQGDERHIERCIAQTLQLGGRQGVGENEGRQRMFGAECLNHWREMIEVQTGGKSHRQAAGDCPTGDPRRIRRPLRIREKRPGPPVEFAPGGCHGHPMAAALQQFHTHFVFQIGELAAEGRLGDPQAPGGAGNVAFVGDHDEIFQMAEFHTNSHTFLVWKVQPKKYERSGRIMVGWGMDFTFIPLKMKRHMRGMIGLLLVAALAWAGFRQWRESRFWAVTDNAYLDGPVHPLAARLIGTVEQVLVEENSRVKQGQELIRLDRRDTANRSRQAEANLAEARAALAAAEASAINARDNARLNDVALDKSRLDLERLRGLSGGLRSAVARQELDHAQAAYDTACAAVVAARSSVDVATAGIEVARAKEATAAVTLDEAVLQCSYTTISAPVDGTVGRRNVESGQPVIPAQPLVALVGDDLWVTANFKEIQIASIQPGQAAMIRFDAFPEREWPGTVESLSPASGARFALLPPDNATGNFTRVVQRVPVRLRLAGTALRELGPRLVPGMSAKVSVKIGGAVVTKPEPPPPGSLTER